MLVTITFTWLEHIYGENVYIYITRTYVYVHAFDFIYNRRQEVINIGKEDIEKQKKMLSKKKPPKNTADFVKPGDKP